MRDSERQAISLPEGDFNKIYILAGYKSADAQ
jgi:hypothetical protein